LQIPTLNLCIKCHEEISYFPIHRIDSLRAEYWGYADNHVRCRHLECGAIGFDNGAKDACLCNPYTAFPDHFFILVFKTVVSGKLDLHTHVDQQFFMGRWNFMFCNRLEKDAGKVETGQSLRA
jgi:hypothetical protein